MVSNKMNRGPAFSVLSLDTGNSNSVASNNIFENKPSTPSGTSSRRKYHFVYTGNDGSAGPSRSSPSRKAIRSKVMHEYTRRRITSSINRLKWSIRFPHKQPNYVCGFVPNTYGTSTPTVRTLESASPPSDINASDLQPKKPVPSATKVRRENYDAWKKKESTQLVIQSPQPRRSTVDLAAVVSGSRLSIDLAAVGSGPRLFLDTNEFDPFSTAGISLTSKMQRHLNICLRIILPNVEQPEHLLDLVELGRVRISTPAGIYASIAFASAYEDISNGEQPAMLNSIANDEKSGAKPPDFFGYKAQAIEEINKALEDPEKGPSDATIVAIINLCAIESILLNDNQLLTHIEGIQQIVKHRGGLRSLPQSMQNIISFIDLKTSHHTSYIPRFTSPALPFAHPKSLITRMLSSPIPSLSQTASSLLALSHPPCMIHPALHSLWVDLRDLTNFTLYRSLFPKHVAREEIRYFRVKNHGIEHGLMSLPHDSSYTKTTKTKFEEACRLASLLYINQAFINNPVPSPFMRQLVIPLQSSLETYMHLPAAYGDDAPTHTLLWLLFIGSLCSVGQAERPWFSAQLAKVAIGMDLAEWEDAKEVLLKCFYNDDALGNGLKAAWREARALM